MPEIKEAELILKKYFGYDSFRPLQADIIRKVLQNKDTLVLMPTGGGKSVCYQIPAMMTDGLCVVVSPLIALMKDQVEALNRNNIPAAFSNSSISLQEQNEVERQCMDGSLKLLYVAPEKLVNESFISFLKLLPISFFAIDEAHCISSWGHDFRPEYTRLKIIRDRFPDKAVIALTATADKLTRQDIVNQLELKNPEIFIASFDRKNIRLYVTPGINRQKKIFQYLNARPNQSGIIYCLSRKNTEDVAQKLINAGYKAACYHAGLDSNQRAYVQEAFRKDDILIVCATIAFGMGIDKPNVRFVIHYNLPKNVESYYQEIGRAGRDGLKSDAIMFYSLRDVIVWRDIITKDENSSPSHQELKIAKLERIQQFAEAAICRRRILLNYFNENLNQDCGNCDVCRNPGEKFDGTIISQKALSACLRLKENVSINTLIDVLRGSKNRIIIEKGYDQIKTFGTGADLTFAQWQNYIQQMINMGVFEIAYDQNYALKQGPLANAILFENQKINLAQISEKPDFEETEKPRTKKQLLAEGLLKALLELRKEIAKEENLAPHLILDDVTLKDLTEKRPLHLDDLVNIKGFSEAKIQNFGGMFLEKIVEVSISQYQEGARIKGMSQLVSYHYYKQGYSPEEIIDKRAEKEKSKLNIVTIYSHLIDLYDKGYPVEIEQFISETELEEITKELEKLSDLNSLKEVYEKFAGRIDYFKIKVAVVLFNKKNNNKIL